MSRYTITDEEAQALREEFLENAWARFLQSLEQHPETQATRDDLRNIVFAMLTFSGNEVRLVGALNNTNDITTLLGEASPRSPEYQRLHALAALNAEQMLLDRLRAEQERRGVQDPQLERRMTLLYAAPETIDHYTQHACDTVWGSFRDDRDGLTTAGGGYTLEVLRHWIDGYVIAKQDDYRLIGALNQIDDIGEQFDVLMPGDPLDTSLPAYQHLLIGARTRLEELLAPRLSELQPV